MITVRQIHKDDWKVLGANAHLACFSESKPQEMERIDYALLIEDGEKIMAYATCREHHADTLYWQYGGTFHGTRNSSLTWSVYQAVIEWCKPRYANITTLIENNNVTMLKMAMKAGFRIVGTRTHIERKQPTELDPTHISAHIYCEMVLEF